MQKEIEAQTKITQLFGQQASKAVGDYAQTKMDEAKALRAQGKEDEANAVESQWGPNGTLRLAAHTLIGGLTGGVRRCRRRSRYAGLRRWWQNSSRKPASKATSQPYSPPLPAPRSGVVGGTTGAGTALNEVANNYLSHQENELRLKAAKACQN